MDDGEWLALWGSWWLWRDTLISAAVCRARSVFWRARVRQALRQNRALNVFPSTQQALSYALERDVGTIQELLGGDRSLTDQTLLGLMRVFRLPGEFFVPKTHVWIASTTTILSDSQIGMPEALCYAIYRTEQALQQEPAQGADLDSDAIQRAVGHPDNAFRSVATVTQVIRNAAQILGPILETRRP